MTKTKLKGEVSLAGLAFVIIISLLMLLPAVADASKKPQNAKADKTEVLLKVMALELDAYFTDYGEIKLTDDETFSEAAEKALTLFNSHYASNAYDIASLETNETEKSFVIRTKSAKDGFGSFIYLYGAPGKRIYVLASPGRNKQLEFLDTGDGGISAIDDILIVMQMK